MDKKYTKINSEVFNRWVEEGWEKGSDSMAIDIVPEWMSNLNDEDIVFIKRFIQ